MGRSKFFKVSSMVAFLDIYSQHTRALIFENFCQDITEPIVNVLEH
jgi:hypothetical protein